MNPELKSAFTLELLKAVHTFGTSFPGLELLALEDLRAVVARAEFAARRPRVIDPGHNPFEVDDDAL